MSWVNLNDVYVNQTGGTIAGDLSVNGALTVNDGKGTNTTYNIANEITTLRDSVSPLVYQRPCEVTFICTSDNQFGIQITNKKTGDAGFITIKNKSEIYANVYIDGKWGHERWLQHSVSQNGDWTIFNFGTGYALSTRKVYKTISATAPYGSLYFCSYRFNSPDIYDSILYADVNPVTGNGLWLGHYVEIKNVTDVRCYLSSATSMSNVGMYVQETVIGKLKQYSVSQISKNPKIYVGTKVVNSWGTAGQLKVFTPTEFSTLFGGEFGTHTHDCVLVMNGDGNANGVYLSAAGYWAGDGIWVKTLNGSGSNNIRINYVVVRLQHSVSQISNRVLLWSGTAGRGVKITINNDYSFKEFKSFYCLTSADKIIGLPLVRNSGIQQDQHLHGITGWDDGTTTWTLCSLIRINTETTATIISMSKHQIDGSGGVAGNLLKLWGYY